MSEVSTQKLQPTAEVVEGLVTMADKIRALAKSGYLRADIAKHLGVRYQHVRGVLNRSGIKNGLKRTVVVALEQVEIELPEEPTQSASWQLLLDGGFIHLADWKLAQEEGIELTVKAPDKPGVYAFVIGETIMYVGITQRTLHQRMYNYRRGYGQQRTSARIKQLIQATLKHGTQIKVLIAMPDEARDWNGLPVDTAAGLEVGLIRLVQPEWNMLGIKAQSKVLAA